jgi:hypothetical protein
MDAEWVTAQLRVVSDELAALRGAEGRATSEKELRSVRAQIGAAQASLDELRQLQPLRERWQKVEEATSPGYWLKSARSAAPAAYSDQSTAFSPAPAPASRQHYTAAPSAAQKVAAPRSLSLYTPAPSASVPTPSAQSEQRLLAAERAAVPRVAAPRTAAPSNAHVHTISNSEVISLRDQNERLKVMVQALEMQKKSSEAEFAASTFQLRAAQAEIESLHAQRRKVSVMMKSMGSDTVAYVKQQQLELDETRTQLAALGKKHSLLNLEHKETLGALSEHRQQLDELKTHSTHMSERLLRETVTAKRESDRDMRASYMEMVKAARLAVASQQLTSRQEIEELNSRLAHKEQEMSQMQQTSQRQIEMLLGQLQRGEGGSSGGGDASGSGGDASGNTAALRQMLREAQVGARRVEQMHQTEREQAVQQTLKLRDHIEQMHAGIQEARDETTNTVRDLLARARQGRAEPLTFRAVDEQLNAFEAMWDRIVGSVGRVPPAAVGAAPALPASPLAPSAPDAGAAAIALNVQRLYRGKQGSEQTKQLVDEASAARALQRVARGRLARKETQGAMVRAREERAKVAVGPGPRSVAGDCIRFEKVLTAARSQKLGMSIALDPDFDLPRISGIRPGGALQRASGQDVATGDLIELIGGEALYGLSCSEIKLKLDEAARPTVLTLMRQAVAATVEGDFFEMVIDRRPGEKLGISLGSSSSNDTVIAAIRPGAVMRLYGASVSEGDIVATVDGEDVREMSLDEIHARVLRAPRPLRIGCYSQQR